MYGEQEMGRRGRRHLPSLRSPSDALAQRRLLRPPVVRFIPWRESDDSAKFNPPGLGLGTTLIVPNLEFTEHNTTA